MFQEKKFKELKKDIFYRASERWKKRKETRKDPSTLKETNVEEFKLQQQRNNNFIRREELRKKGFAVTEKKIILNERIIRDNDLMFFAPSDDAKKAGIPVARIEIKAQPGFQNEGFATGFLIGPNLLMTNFHVFPEKEDAQGCVAHFLYERTQNGIQNGYVFDIEPDRFFMADFDLDFSIVYISSTSLEGNITLRNFEPLQLIETKGKIVTGQPLSIIQYAGGGPKQYAYSDNLILDILEEEGFVQYSTDTLRGSSGSPCYNLHWEVAALHHSGVPFIVDGKIMSTSGAPWDGETEDDIQWVANEGISISAIVKNLRTQKGQTPEADTLLQALLASTADPLLSSSSVDAKPEERITSLRNKTDETTIVLPTSKPAAMSTIQFNFYGPTTIYVNPASVAAETNGQSAVKDSFAPSLLEKKQRFDENYSDRKGYDPDFLQGFKIALPRVNQLRQDELFMDFETNKPYVVNYYHYSLVMNKKRRFCMWTASNINYNANKKSDKDRKEFGGEDWRLDPRIPAKYQVQDDELYKPATNIDRGHIVRREDNCWGNSELEIEHANADTYHWTNCTPQHERFNQYRSDGLQGLWGKLETAVQQQLDIVDQKAIVFAGPVLRTEDDAEDFGRGSIQYPNLYWKIVLVNEAQDGLVAYGFILDQTNVVNQFGLFEEAMLDFQQFKAQQATIAKISQMTGVLFDQQVYDADVLKTHPGLEDEAISFGTTAALYLKRKRLVVGEKEVKVDGALVQ
jgi:endonuclease G, mitochondrial